MPKTRPSIVTLWFLVACAIVITLFAAPVRAQPGFSLSATPGKLYLNEHGVAATMIAIQPANGFAGSVAFSVSGLPAGVVAAFDPGTTTSSTTLALEAGIVAQTGTATVTVTGTSGALTEAVTIPLAVSAATGTGGVGLLVNLSPSYNVYGIYTNGTPFSTGGLDGVGWAYSVNLLTESRELNGVRFDFGPANQLDAVSGTGQPILLPHSHFTQLAMLATGVEGNQTAQIIKVTYTDGTTAEFVRNFSDWFTPQNYLDEYEAVTMPYRDMSDGGLDSRGNFYLYAHYFDLDSSKTVESFTLPDNRDLVVLAVTLL
jgi:hypothetical protein